jgi:cell division septum initiation protein DivIVA
VAGEKKFGTSLFGFKRADVNAYIERIIREFDQRLKEKDDENSSLKSQVKDLKVKYEEAFKEAETVLKEKEKIAGVLLQAQEKAENMMVEAQEKALMEKAHLDQVLESEREKIVDIKRELKGLKNQVTDILSKYEQQIDEAVLSIEKREEIYIQAGSPVSEEENPAV